MNSRYVDTTICIGSNELFDDLIFCERGGILLSIDDVLRTFQCPLKLLILDLYSEYHRNVLQIVNSDRIHTIFFLSLFRLQKFVKIFSEIDIVLISSVECHSSSIRIHNVERWSVLIIDNTRGIIIVIFRGVKFSRVQDHEHASSIGIFINRNHIQIQIEEIIKLRIPLHLNNRRFQQMFCRQKHLSID